MCSWMLHPYQLYMYISMSYNSHRAFNIYQCVANNIFLPLCLLLFGKWAFMNSHTFRLTWFFMLFSFSDSLLSKYFYAPLTLLWNVKSFFCICSDCILLYLICPSIHTLGVFIPFVITNKHSICHTDFEYITSYIKTHVNRCKLIDLFISYVVLSLLE